MTIAVDAALKFASRDGLVGNSAEDGNAGLAKELVGLTSFYTICGAEMTVPELSCPTRRLPRGQAAAKTIATNLFLDGSPWCTSWRSSQRLQDRQQDVGLFHKSR
jgi:hypothetical protein